MSSSASTPHLAARSATMRRDLLMQRRSPALRDARVGLVADERVTEPPHLVAEDVRRLRLDEVPPRQRHECRAHVDVDEGLHDPGRERLSVHGGRLGDLALGFGKPVEPRREQRVDRVRDAGSRLPAQTPAAARGRAGSRPPRRESPHGCRRRAPCRRRGGRATRGPRSGGSASRRIDDAFSRPPAHSGRVSRSSGSREAEQQDRRSRELGNVLDEVEERRRRPVQVLEHEDDRPLSRERLEQPASGPGRLLDGARRRRFARRRSDPRRDELAVPLAREDAGGPRRDAPARKRGEARRGAARTWRLGRRRVCGRPRRSQLRTGGRPPRGRDASCPRRGSRTP